MAEKQGGVYSNWFEKILGPYTKLLREVLIKLPSIPRYPSIILEKRDIPILIGFCELFNIEYDKEMLRNRDYFIMKKYQVLKEVKRIAEEKLKPEDPYLRLLDKIDVKAIKDVMKKDESEEI